MAAVAASAALTALAASIGRLPPEEPVTWAKLKEMAEEAAEELAESEYEDYMGEDL